MNTRRINWRPQCEGGWMNSLRFHATRLMPPTYYRTAYHPRAPPPFVCSAAASRYPIEAAVPFNKDQLPLCSKHSTTLWLHKAGNAIRQAPQSCQMHLMLAEPQASIPPRTVLASVAALSNELQHEACCRLVTAKQLLGQLGYSPIFHRMITHSLESSQVAQVAFTR